jgi:hypothetical protein
MNVASITNARSPLADQFEIESVNAAAADVEEMSGVGAAETELSDEAQAGLLRFARFIKEQTKDMPTQREASQQGDSRRHKALQAYGKFAKSKKDEQPGQMLNVRL